MDNSSVSMFEVSRFAAMGIVPFGETDPQSRKIGEILSAAGQGRVV